MEQALPPAESAPVEPQLAEPQPNWPPWYSIVGFMAAIVCTLLAVGIILAVAGVSEDSDSPTVTVVATLVQSVFFVGTALIFARSVAPPKLWHFGLRQAP